MKSFRSISPYLLSAVVLGFSFHFADAQSANNYTLLAPLPYVGSSIDTSGSGAFAGYVNAIYKAAILIAGVLAVVMITLGGVEYMASDTPFSKSDGKEKIKNAVTGLILLVSCYLILNTINPQLLNLDITIEPVGSGLNSNLDTGPLNVNSGSSADTSAGASTNSGNTDTTTNIPTQTLNSTSGSSASGGTTGSDGGFNGETNPTNPNTGSQPTQTLFDNNGTSNSGSNGVSNSNTPGTSGTGGISPSNGGASDVDIRPVVQ